MQLLNYLKNEFRKYLDLKYLSLLVSGPLLIVILTVIQTIQTGAGSFTAGGSNGLYVIQQNLSLWGLLLVTPFIASIAIYLAYIEHHNNIWKLLFTLQAKKGQIMLTKVLFLVLSIFTIYLLLFIINILEIIILDQIVTGFSYEFTDIGQLLGRHTVMLLISFAIGLFHFAVALWFENPILPFVLAVLLTIVNFLMVNSAISYLSPWSLVTIFAQLEITLEFWQVLLSPALLSILSLGVIFKRGVNTTSK